LVEETELDATMKTAMANGAIAHTFSPGKTAQANCVTHERRNVLLKLLPYSLSETTLCARG
jgi:hypothetical protein